MVVVEWILLFLEEIRVKGEDACEGAAALKVKLLI